MHLTAAAAGSREAFVLVYDALAASVFGLALRILRDRHQAEDVTQETFLGVWQQAARFDPARGSARAWVLTMAHRRAVDRIRTNELIGRREQDYTRSTHVIPFDETSAAAHALHDARRVRAALACLTPAQREAIDLAYFDGYTHAEVSQLLQIPLGTAKTRIRDSLIRLRVDLMDALPRPA